MKEELQDNKRKLRRLTRLALLFALALVFSWVESLLPPISPFPIKLGLSNVPVMFCLLSFGLPEALILAFLKSGFIFLVNGSFAFLMSLAGGVSSVLLMALCEKSFKNKPSYLFISIIGAMTHNFAQYLVLQGLFQFKSPVRAGMLAPLLLLGMGSGVLTGLLLKAVLPLLSRLED